MLLSFEVSFPVINNLFTPSSELQINFDVMQIDTKNSATGRFTIIFYATEILKWAVKLFRVGCAALAKPMDKLSNIYLCQLPLLR